MTLLDRLERRFGRFAIHGLIRYVAALNALVYILIRTNPAMLGFFVLSPAAILHGEVWRLFTYIFIPQFGSSLLPGWLSAAMYVLFLWWVGDGLEEAWGSFRVNLYYFLGMFGITVSAFLFGSGFSNPLLNSSLLFAFAHLYPDVTIVIMYILPAKVKWIAWFTGALLFLGFVGGGFDYQVGLIVALSNYFLFFGPELVRNARNRQKISQRRQEFAAAQKPEEDTLHRCAVCRRTEQSNPELEFRVSRDGEEYCREHLPKAAAAA